MPLPTIRPALAEERPNITTSISQQIVAFEIELIDLELKKCDLGRRLENLRCAERLAEENPTVVL